MIPMKQVCQVTDIFERTIVDIHKKFAEMVHPYTYHPIYFDAFDIVEIDEKELRWYLGLRESDRDTLVVEGNWYLD